MRRGVVYLVGAGPGDPDLLTVRARRLIRRAEVVIHDRLVDARILALAPAFAEIVGVGKAPGGGGTRQEEINALMAAYARAGRRVVRLKGGDPLVFGRGGEELAYLGRCGIAVEVVPGITAALGAASRLGVPLTHRRWASTVTLVAGHVCNGGREPDWAALANGGGTLAIYMGIANAGRIAERLLAAGLDGVTPIAVIENATGADERILFGILERLEVLIRDAGVAAPALILVGDVVSLALAEAAPERRAAG